MSEEGKQKMLMTAELAKSKLARDLSRVRDADRLRALKEREEEQRNLNAIDRRTRAEEEVERQTNELHAIENELKAKTQRNIALKEEADREASKLRAEMEEARENQNRARELMEKEKGTLEKELAGLEALVARAG